MSDYKHEAMMFVGRLLNEGVLTLKEVKDLRVYFELHEDLFLIEDGKIYPTNKLQNLHSELRT